ncbi:hypothetical protein ACSSS7_006783 [Eimeria intestinalis]
MPPLHSAATPAAQRLAAAAVASPAVSLSVVAAAAFGVSLHAAAAASPGRALVAVYGQLGGAQGREPSQASIEALLPLLTACWRLSRVAILTGIAGSHARTSRSWDAQGLVRAHSHSAAAAAVSRQQQQQQQN